MLIALSQKKQILFFLLGSLFMGGVLLFFKGDISPIDAHLFFTKSELESIFINLGDVGRGQHLFLSGLDIVFIFFYTGLFVSIYKKIFAGVDQKRFLLGVPFILSVVDLVETFLIILSLQSFPDLNSVVLISLVVLTPLKWFMLSITIFVAINGYALQKYFALSKG